MWHLFLCFLGQFSRDCGKRIWSKDLRASSFDSWNLSFVDLLGGASVKDILFTFPALEYAARTINHQTSTINHRRRSSPLSATASTGTGNGTNMATAAIINLFNAVLQSPYIDGVSPDLISCVLADDKVPQL